MARKRSSHRKRKRNRRGRPNPKMQPEHERPKPMTVGDWWRSHWIMSQQYRHKPKSSQALAFRVGYLGACQSNGYRQTKVVRGGFIRRHHAPRGKVVAKARAGVSLPVRTRNREAQYGTFGRGRKSGERGRLSGLENVNCETIEHLTRQALFAKSKSARSTLRNFNHSTKVVRQEFRCNRYASDRGNWSRGQSGGAILHPKTRQPLK